MARRRAALTEAHALLLGRDEVFDRLVERHGPALLPAPGPASRRFHDLARSVVYQQLHGRAAATIWSRVCDVAGEATVTPRRLLEVGNDALRGAGLSGAKARCILDLSERIEIGEISLGRIGRLADEEVIATLVPVWGIGRWTAQMFLIFTLGRLDVWPTGDYAVRAGFATAWGLAEHPTEREMAPLGEPFAGGRSLVAWYCWREVDGPVWGEASDELL